jgi:hypothetical protein
MSRVENATERMSDMAIVNLEVREASKQARVTGLCLVYLIFILKELKDRSTIRLIVLPKMIEN